MIPLRFGLWWSGTKLSYLRYLTFKSLREFHPDSKIELYVGDEFENKGYKWGVEKQDFECNNIGKNYLDRLEELDVKVTHTDMFKAYPSNYQSDFFRWWWIKENGGFYMDTDQIILRSFETLDLSYDFIYSSYQAPSCGLYTPVGVIGGTKEAEVVTWVNDILPKYYNPNDYNSLGPFMFRSVLGTRNWRDRMYNTGSELFYPAKDSCLVPALYCNMPETASIANNLRKAYALHWFGGHPASQAFNKKYTETQAKTALDLISTIVREKEIV